jgi:hypothetical protein
MLSVIMLSVIMLSVIMLSVIMLSVIMLSVIMLNVVASMGLYFQLRVQCLEQRACGLYYKNILTIVSDDHK